MTSEQRIELAKKLQRIGINFSHHETSHTSSWRFHVDGITMYTDDGGAEEILRAYTIEVQRIKESSQIEESWEKRMQEEIKEYYRNQEDKLWNDIGDKIRDYFNKRDDEKNRDNRC